MATPTGWTEEEMRKLARETSAQERRNQGLPEKISDPAELQWIYNVVHSDERHRRMQKIFSSSV